MITTILCIIGIIVCVLLLIPTIALFILAILVDKVEREEIYGEYYGRNDKIGK